MKFKKIISLILSLIMMTTLCTPVVLAIEGTTITIPNAEELAGSTVVLDVQLENNPGITAAVLTFTFDEELELLSIKNGDAFSSLSMTTSKVLASPFKITWDGESLKDEDIKDGVIASLEFKIPDDAVVGTIYNVSASCTPSGIADNNLNPVSVNIVNGSIEVKDFNYGDLNADRTIDNIDTTLLRRHIAGGYNQSIKEAAADVNVDGEVNASDTVLLRRFIAGGYGVTFPYIQTGCNHVLEEIPAKAATEETEGNKAHWHCKVCDSLFLDSQGKTPTTKAEITVDKVPKSQYSIQYMCDMVPQADDTYNYGVEKLLPVPTLDKYTFVGWSDENGKIWKTIPAGTVGDLILYANWSSDRNKAISAEHLSDPSIMIDSQNGLIYFSYKIGKIINVPLYQMSEFLTANGVETEITTTKSVSQKVQTSQEIAKTLSEATTNSTSWTLSNDWNNVTEVSEAYMETHELTREIAETLAKNSAGSYTVGYQSGGTSGTTNASSSNYAISNNNSQHREFEYQNENSVVSTVDHKFNAELTASAPIYVVDVNAKVDYHYNNNEVTSTSNSEKFAGTNDWSQSEDYSESKSNTSSNSKSWNSTANSTSSWSEEKTNSVKNAVSEMVTREYNVNNSYELGGSESNNIGKSTVTGEENKLTSTVLYDTTEITTEAVTYRTTGNTHGGYRIVLAGTLQVYAVVVYDIATREYSVQTYSVLGDGSDNDAPKPYLDYSWEGNQFNDYENSVLPFEIPYEVNGYVNSLVAKTDGLAFDPDTATVTRFNNNLGSELVYIPTYISVDNGDDTYSFTEIKSLSKDLFKNNTNIKAVRLGNGITEIPDGAFEGCTNLTDVYAPNVTKIGERAFAGCEKLKTFTINEAITHIGSNAFEGVSSINATVCNIDVAQAVAHSGANNIILNISKIPDDKNNNIEFNIGNIEKFELRGGGNEYPGLSIVSNAKNTVLNRISFTQNTKTPITLSSENVTLDQVSVDCTGYALILKADTTNLTISRTTNNLLSSTGIAAICKNVNIIEMSDSNFENKLRVKGDILVCNSYSGDDLVEFIDGEFKVITEEDEYENYLTSRKVTFDVNGGVLGTETNSKMVPYNGVMGELPYASRDYHDFEGWYTEAEGGELVTEETLMTSLTDITLYAHWSEKILSEWTLASNVPDDAETVNTKYKYTLTEYTTSASSSMSGWEKYKTTSVWSDYGSWSGWQNWDPGASDSRQIESRWIEPTYKTQYNYSGYTNNAVNAWHFCDVLCRQYYGSAKYIESGWVDTDVAITSQSGQRCSCHGSFYGYYSYGGKRYYYKNTRSVVVTAGYTQWRYRDRSLIYTYYYKRNLDKESAEYPTGNNISNIQEWVQYRAK